MRKFTIIEKFFGVALIGLLIYILLCPHIKAFSQEFARDKNVATYILAPLVNSTNTTLFSSGANNTAFYITYQDNNGVYGNVSQAAGNITKILNANLFNWPLNQTEMNHDRITAFYNVTGNLEQVFEIDTVQNGKIDNVYTALGNGTVNATGITAAQIRAEMDANSTKLIAINETTVGIKTQTDKTQYDAQNRTVSNTTVNMDKSNYTINGTLAF